MKKSTLSSAGEAAALARFALITKIEDYLRQGASLVRALHWSAAVPVNEPNGLERYYAPRTLEDWWYAYQQQGFAGLYPKERTDKGQPRCLTAEQQEWIRQQVQTHPQVPVKILYLRWQEQGRQLPSLNSVYRFLREHELDAQRRAQQSRQPPTGPTKAFEAPFVNDLWMVDFSNGPYLRQPGAKKALATHLCLILDDHSRIIPYGAYYPAPNTQAFHQTFKEAILRRGIPLKLYTDQGQVFTNEHTQVVCANLGIRLLHAKPYHAWSKGKIERLFRTLQQSFESNLRLPGQGVDTLAELNHQLSIWIETVYHPRTHSATGVSPQERFNQAVHQLRHLDPHQDIHRLFYTRVHRTVRNDGTVRLENELYEVDLALRGLTIQLRFDPFSRDHIEVYYRGQSFGIAQLIDRQSNSLF